MHRPDGWNVPLVAEAFREGGVWRLRLSGPPWLLADLARELDETGQQLDIVATLGDAGNDQMFGYPLSSVDLSVAPRRKRAPRRSAKGGPVVVDREALLRP
jgi:hypothetical protein